MAFHVGQKVVCISDDWLHDGNPLVAPEVVKGHVYTVVTIGSAPYPCLRLEGVSFYYHQAGFRPVVERKTSIEVFTKMLKPVKELVP